MATKYATARTVDRDELDEFLRTRHRGLLATTRRDGRPQLSPVSCGVDPEGRIVIATYPRRAKSVNAKADDRVSICVQGADWNDEYVQVDGRAEVLDMPEALDGLVEYFRSISGEHPDWDEYRDAMRRQDKSLLRITIERWGPIATGGFPPELADDGQLGRRRGGAHELDLEAVLVLQVHDVGASGDRVQIARRQRRPAEARRTLDDLGERRLALDPEREVVEAGTEPAVEHPRHHVGRLLERHAEPAGVTEQRHVVDRAVARVAETSEQPAPRALGALAVGDPQRQVVQHRPEGSERLRR